MNAYTISKSIASHAVWFLTSSLNKIDDQKECGTFLNTETVDCDTKHSTKSFSKSDCSYVAVTLASVELCA